MPVLARAAIAIGAAGVDESDFDRAVSYVAAEVEEAIEAIHADNPNPAP